MGEEQELRLPRPDSSPVGDELLGLLQLGHQRLLGLLLAGVPQLLEPKARHAPDRQGDAPWDESRSHRHLYAGGGVGGD